MTRYSRLLLILAFGFAVACGDEDPPEAPASEPEEDAADMEDVEPDEPEPDVIEEVGPDLPEVDYDQPGPFAVGRLSFELNDGDRGRTFRVEVWYPADEGARAVAEAGEPVEALIVGEERRATYAGLLAEAPEGCPTRTSHAALEAVVSDEVDAWPLAVTSHCFQCLRLSGMTIATHLASHGIVVAAPDHTDDTLFDKLDGAEGQLTDDFLQVRAADIRAVMDHLLSDAAPELLKGRLDPARVGVYGHSFGAVTTGRVLQTDPRPLAGLALAAPMENPLFQSVKIDEIDKPVMWLVAREDNSITEFGNRLIRTNYERANPPAWKVEVDDAGHWSFSDLCGLVDDFQPGCGEGERQTERGEAFTYIPVTQGLQIARRYTAAFFAAHLLGNPHALDALVEAVPEELVSAEGRTE